MLFPEPIPNYPLGGPYNKHKKPEFMQQTEIVIKAKDLRIGNILFIQNDILYNYVTVIGISKDSFKVEGDEIFPHDDEYNDIEGVLLTPEILEKCGFILGKPFRDSQSFVHKTLDDIEIELTGSEYQLSVNSDEFKIGKPFHFIHELQNLVHALTGEELEVNL